MKREMINICIEYLKKRPISLVLLVLSAFLAFHCAFSIGCGAVHQSIRDIIFVLFFPTSLMLFVRKWTAFVVVNAATLCLFLGMSVFLMVYHVDPLMGGCYVTVSLVFIGLLFHEYYQVSSSSGPESSGVTH